MSYKCNSCGYETEYLPTCTDYHPYGDGYADETRLNDMCACGGDMVEGEHCRLCGRFSEYITDGLCIICYEEQEYNYDEQ